MPQFFAEIAKKINLLFVVLVVLPTVIAIIYFGFLASDVYISQSKFVVRSPEKQAPTTGLGVLLSGAGFSSGGNEIYSAQAFAESRDALMYLNSQQAYRKAMSDPHIWYFDRFGAGGFQTSFENLYKYFQSHVIVETDTTTSIVTLTVRAYTPTAARKFNEKILDVTEVNINKMNARGQADLIRDAQRNVDEAENKARNAAVALAAYRNRSGVIDPETQATAQLQLISKLQDEQIATRAQLSQLRAFTPQNPQIPILDNRLHSLTKEIRTAMGSTAGGDRSLAAAAVEYQRLFLENDFASKQLTATLASLQEARADARRQQVYVERIVQPNLPDSAIEPRRLRSILTAFALGLVAWGIGSMLLAGVKEHAQ